MSRLPPLTPDALTPTQRRLYESVAGGPRAKGPRAAPLTDESGALAGPFNALLHAPEIGEAVQQLGAILRFGGTLPASSRETAILTVARHWRANYEWHAHAAIARREGLDAAAIDAIREGRAPEGDDALAAVHFFVGELLGNARVSDQAYAAVRDRLGEAGTVELVVLAGYYSLIAGVLNAFEVELPPGATPPFGE